MGKKSFKSSLVSKVICFMFALTTLMSIGMIPANAAGNYHDAPFTYNGSGTGAWRLQTDPRGKWDNTCAYIYNKNSNVDFSSVRVYEGDYINCDGSFWDQDGTLWGPYYVARGKYRYLYNTVKEDGWPYARLVMDLAQTTTYYSVYALWSPDSI